MITSLKTFSNIIIIRILSNGWKKNYKINLINLRVKQTKLRNCMYN